MGSNIFLLKCLDGVWYTFKPMPLAELPLHGLRASLHYTVENRQIISQIYWRFGVSFHNNIHNTYLLLDTYSEVV